jgi:NAD(P) transhydrogenase subunit beta
VTLDLRDAAISLSYIAAAVLFIFGLKQLSSARTARSGNRLAAVGMFIALAATLLDRQILSFWLIAVGILIGAIVGVVSARRVKMTAMPQMVALFNGAGGATAALISLVEYLHLSHQGAVPPLVKVASVLGIAIGAISFSGSLIAFGKLQELLSSKPLKFPFQRLFNLALLLGAIALGALVVMDRQGAEALWILFGVTLLLGALATLAIGGGDMPVVIAVLNSMTGIATAITGLELNNEMLIVAGMLVGASGTLLTVLMSRAMNRSIANVLFSGFGGGAPAAGAGASTDASGLTARETTIEDTAVALAYARRVIVIPGYGLAVAQAQHDLAALCAELTRRGVDVKHAMHPVAGRMPGHMNVLLAEANVPYDQLVDMEQINSAFESTDVALVVGANDVENPAAREDPSSPIYGMPILDADKAKLCIVLKRGMAAGFAGIDNALFYRPNTRMLFGDAKKSLSKLVEAIKSV